MVGNHSKSLPLFSAAAGQDQTLAHWAYQGPGSCPKDATCPHQACLWLHACQHMLSDRDIIPFPCFRVPEPSHICWETQRWSTSHPVVPTWKCPGCLRWQKRGKSFFPPVEESSNSLKAWPEKGRRTRKFTLPGHGKNSRAKTHSIAARERVKKNILNWSACLG